MIWHCIAKEKMRLERFLFNIIDKIVRAGNEETAMKTERAWFLKEGKGSISISVRADNEKCHLSQRRFPSILAKIPPPPSTMGFG